MLLLPLNNLIKAWLFESTYLAKPPNYCIYLISQLQFFFQGLFLCHGSLHQCSLVQWYIQDLLLFLDWWVVLNFKSSCFDKIFIKMRLASQYLHCIYFNTGKWCHKWILFPALGLFSRPFGKIPCYFLFVPLKLFLFSLGSSSLFPISLSYVRPGTWFDLTCSPFGRT